MNVQRLIGRYEVLETIGSGSMGEVLKCRSIKLRRIVAIKTMFSRLLTSDEIRARFFQEAQVMASMRHPNIVTIFDFGQEQNSPYIVMEFLDGFDLRYFQSVKRHLSFPRTLHLLMQTAAGLDYAHLHHIVHRDIKPANILLSRSGCVKIVDFGIARLAEGTGFTKTGIALGTPAYMSPEQAQGQRVDARSDQFSLGVVGYEMLCGANPFRAEDYASTLLRIVNHTPPPLQNFLPPDLQPLGHAISRLLQKNKENRYNSMAEFARICYDLLGRYSEEESQLSGLFAGDDQVNDAASGVSRAIKDREEPQPVESTSVMEAETDGDSLDITTATDARIETPPESVTETTEKTDEEHVARQGRGEIRLPPLPPGSAIHPRPVPDSADIQLPPVPAESAQFVQADQAPADVPLPQIPTDSAQLLQAARNALEEGDLHSARDLADMSESRASTDDQAVITQFKSDLDLLWAEKQKYESESMARQWLREAWSYLDTNRIDLALSKARQAQEMKIPQLQTEILQLERKIEERLQFLLQTGSIPMDVAQMTLDQLAASRPGDAPDPALMVAGGDEGPAEELDPGTGGPGSSLAGGKRPILERRMYTDRHGMIFVFINPGEFVMGDSYGDADERPTHVVRISEGFYMQTMPVTQRQWLKVMPENPSSFRGDDLPVERVSYEDAQEFIARLNAYGQVSYRLPTEAQWEFACRAGQKTTYYWGEEMQDGYCWYDENSGHRPHPVGEKLPNNWGLYDMLGNVWEWCLDWYDSSYYRRSPHADPPGPIHGEQRVVRGGSWFGSPFICRSSNRGSYPARTVKDNLGFRLAISPKPGGSK